MGQDTQVAVFIDYDNIEISVEEAFGKNIDVDWNRVMQTATQMGRVVLRRAYADWAEAASRQRQLLNLGVELVHVNSKRGKNAADIRIVIDALELLFNDKNSFSHVLLVSGDGDFTELVHRLRAHGKNVIGMGISGTSAEYLVNACDKFIYYDKLQGINKPKKNPQNGNGQNQNQPAAQKPKEKEKESAPAPKQNGLPMATTAQGKLEQYLHLLANQKIRMTPTEQRPLIIYKLYEITKANPDFSFNDLKEFAEVYFANATPKIEAQLVTDTAHQLFHTFCFEFDPESHDRIWNRKLSFSPEVQKASDLLDKCDHKILQLLVNAVGSPDKIDKEIAARILYGSVRNPKVIDHVQDLLTSE